jgi:hypothetical protein
VNEMTFYIRIIQIQALLIAPFALEYLIRYLF